MRDDRYSFWVSLILLATAFLWLRKGRCDDYSLYLREASIDYARYQTDTREPVLYPNVPKERLDLNLDVAFLKYGYIRNTVHSETDYQQFRLIGWKYQVGAHIGPWADVYVEHFSQHLLDQPGVRPHPLENLIGVRVYLYRRENR